MKISRPIAALCAAAIALSSLLSFSAAAEDESADSYAVTEASSAIVYRLSNPKADENTKKTYGYICDNFGNHMISCQQESTWMGSPDYEMNYIKDTTGKLPAMRGLDFMNGDFDGVVKRAKEWHAKGGIVTICWHTGVNGKGYQESLNDNPDFKKILTEGTPENKAMIANWDKAAKALQQLRDAGVPVLWRPFHEFDGQWFWWGKGGSENFKKLWQMMYDRYTNEFGLNNLIWVLGYSGSVKSGWYPGDDYCDIIGSDTYDNSTHKAAWKKLDAMKTGKPLAFHECGNVPSAEQFKKDGCLWSWFMVWHTDYITGNDKTNLSEVYNSDLVITLDELPDLKKYVPSKEIEIYVDKVNISPAFSCTADAVRINWDTVRGADGYRVYAYDKKAKTYKTLKTIGKGSTNTYRISGLASGTEYKYKVKAYIRDADGTPVWGLASDEVVTATKPKAARIKSNTATKTAVRINWDPVSGADGYKVQQYDSSAKKWKTIKLTAKTTYRISGLKANKTYKYRVQAYKRVAATKTYSKWSDTYSAKTKK